MIDEIKKHCMVHEKYGFTLPYLYKIELDAGRKKTIEEIFLFLSKHQECKYIISYCSDLDEFIIGLHKNEYAPVEMYHNFGNLHYDQDKIGVFNEISELILFFCNKYQKIIDSNHYSKNIDTQKWE
ncbi:hypothetical protein [Flavobacterium sp. HSC-61S13]|uniref:hypothetical protein n=1 Tax=Flavobacterium sp. HSC-61S13 TaxID=2910963 RepID=UPI00209E23FF|nr:hypothetical protein [Flavobacterium sp. HSC-61S13]MCP1994620.1 hypothetical protein [Flavobacterium sp. HSC-61S13]